ncbi:hypothetical protein HY213_05510 [Candidatus Peregrinibacteria bacterium]|nr:hypothetical protein [Candidatus Peregrinibacteria bacterium]
MDALKKGNKFDKDFEKKTNNHKNKKIEFQAKRDEDTIQAKEAASKGARELIKKYLENIDQLASTTSLDRHVKSVDRIGIFNEWIKDMKKFDPDAKSYLLSDDGKTVDPNKAPESESRQLAIEKAHEDFLKTLNEKKPEEKIQLIDDQANALMANIKAEVNHLNIASAAPAGTDKVPTISKKLGLSTFGTDHIELYVKQLRDLQKQKDDLNGTKPKEDAKPDTTKPSTPEKLKEPLTDDDKKKTFDPAIEAFNKDGNKTALETAYKNLGETKKENAIAYIQEKLKDYTVTAKGDVLSIEKKSVTTTTEKPQESKLTADEKKNIEEGAKKFREVKTMEDGRTQLQNVYDKAKEKDAALQYMNQLLGDKHTVGVGADKKLTFGDPKTFVGPKESDENLSPLMKFLKQILEFLKSWRDELNGKITDPKKLEEARKQTKEEIGEKEKESKTATKERRAALLKELQELHEREKKINEELRGYATRRAAACNKTFDRPLRPNEVEVEGRFRARVHFEPVLDDKSEQFAWCRMNMVGSRAERRETSTAMIELLNRDRDRERVPVPYVQQGDNILVAPTYNITNNNVNVQNTEQKVTNTTVTNIIGDKNTVGNLTSAEGRVKQNQKQEALTAQVPIQAKIDAPVASTPAPAPASSAAPKPRVDVKLDTPPPSTHKKSTSSGGTSGSRFGD